MSYIGNTNTTQGFVPAVDYFNGNGSTTAFTLSRPVASVAQVQAVIENVPQNPGSAFTVSGSTITFTSAPPSGTSNIYVYYTSPNTQVIQPGQGTVGTAQLANGLAFSQWTTTGSDIYYNTGNVGIGTSSIPADSKVAISGTGLVLQDASGAIQRFNKTLGADTGWISNRSYSWHDGNGIAISTQTADALKFGTNSSERARINSSGDFLVGTTAIPSASTGNAAALAPTNYQIPLLTSRNTTGGAEQARFYNPNGLVGSISTSGSSTSFNTSSDYRLKENVQPMTGALSRVSALKPVTYTWKVDGSEGEGFIAHELAEICPHAVTGEKDAVDADGNPVYQGIDVSFLVGILTAAIQELKADLDATKAELAALKGPQ